MNGGNTGGDLKILGGKRSEIRVGLATPDPDYLAEIREFLATPGLGLGLTEATPDLSSLLEAAKEGKIEVALVDDAMLRAEQKAALKGLRQAGVAKVVVLVSDLGGGHPAGIGAEAGAELLYKYSPGRALVEAIRRLAAPPDFGKTAEKQPKQIDKSFKSIISPLPAGRGFPQVLTVYSPAGGVGKTTLAVHLAVSLARRDLRVALVDLSQFGSIAPLLRLSPRGKGLSNILTILRQEPEAAVGPDFPGYLREAFLEYRFPGGILDVLPAAPPTRMDQFEAEDASSLLEGLVRAGYQAVVVDTSGELSGRNVGIFERSTRILLVTSPHTTAAWGCLQAVEVMDDLYIPRDRLALVVNRFRWDVAFNLDEVRSLLGLPLAGVLPEAPRAVHGPTNRGKAVPPAGHFGYAGALRRLVDQLSPWDVQTTEGRRSAIESLPADGRG